MSFSYFLHYSPVTNSRPLPECALVSSRLLQADCATDVIGNAAALDVNKFLSRQYQGKTLLAWMQDDEDTVIASFQADDREMARQWVQSFLGLIRTPERHVSHTLAKQLYWLVGDDPCQDDQFHLLAPLYASSLAHSVYETIQKHRFSDETKAAREAKRNKKPCAHILHEYPNPKYGTKIPTNLDLIH